MKTRSREDHGSERLGENAVESGTAPLTREVANPRHEVRGLSRRLIWILALSSVVAAPFLWWTATAVQGEGDLRRSMASAKSAGFPLRVEEYQRMTPPEVATARRDFAPILRVFVAQPSLESEFRPRQPSDAEIERAVDLINQTLPGQSLWRERTTPQDALWNGRSVPRTFSLIADTLNAHGRKALEAPDGFPKFQRTVTALATMGRFIGGDPSLQTAGDAALFNRRAYGLLLRGLHRDPSPRMIAFAEGIVRAHRPVNLKRALFQDAMMAVEYARPANPRNIAIPATAARYAKKPPETIIGAFYESPLSKGLWSGYWAKRLDHLVRLAKMVNGGATPERLVRYDRQWFEEGSLPLAKNAVGISRVSDAYMDSDERELLRGTISVLKARDALCRFPLQGPSGYRVSPDRRSFTLRTNKPESVRSPRPWITMSWSETGIDFDP